MPQENHRNIPFFILLGVATLLFLYLLTPFFFPIFWAAVIAGIFHPLYRRINRRLERPNLTAAVVFALIALILLLPTGVVGTLVFNQTVQLYERVDKTETGRKPFEKKFEEIVNAITDHPYAHLFEINKPLLIAKAGEVARGVTNFMFTRLTALTQNTLGLLIQFAIMLYTLFYFLRDGGKFLRMATRICPLGMGREQFLWERFIVTARSSLKVMLIIGGLQGLLGGIVFFIAGVEGAAIWGLLMIVLAILPVVGCALIWFPVGLVMLAMGSLWEGILILSFGGLVISSVDNLLRPVLIGKDVAMHPLLIFISTLGGIVLFGFSGFVVGPIITSMMISVWDMYDKFYRRDPAEC
jgi:predicted PurR-regulated permease PerM